jgi:hypothetical protein
MTKYKVDVQTGSMRHAGTDADVFIQLVGAGKLSPEIELDNTANNFEKGQLDTFEIDTPDVGWINQIRIFHNNKGDHPGWYLKYVEVLDEDINIPFRADFDRWLARDEGDKRIDVTMPVPVGPVSLPAGNISTNYIGYVAFREKNDISVPRTVYRTVTYRVSKGIYVSTNAAVTIKGGMDAGFKIFDIGCSFTAEVIASIAAETGSSVEEIIDISTDITFDLLPNTSATVIVMFFNNVLVGEATAHGIKTGYEDKFMITPDIAVFEGFLSNTEVENRVAEMLTAIFSDISGSAQIIRPSKIRTNKPIALASTLIKGPIVKSGIKQSLNKIRRTWPKKVTLKHIKSPKKITPGVATVRPK